MIQGGLFGFPLLLIVLTVLIASEVARETFLMLSSVYLQFRIWNQHRALAEDGESHRSETET